MRSTESTLFTAADYRALGEGPPHHQLIEGELIMAPAPSSYHQMILCNLIYFLRTHLETQPIGKIFPAPFDVYFDETNVLQPDLVFIANSRMAMVGKDGAHGAPDLVVEILSPATARLDLDQKRGVYARCGVAELWIIVPDSRQIQIYRLQEDPIRPAAIYEQTDTFRSALFPGLDIPAAQIFAE